MKTAIVILLVVFAIEFIASLAVLWYIRKPNESPEKNQQS